MKREYRELRLQQLSSSSEAFQPARNISRPTNGWLRAVREAVGISQQEVANALHIKRQSVVDFETAEADDRITLRNLRRMAGAMNCELVYAIVPKSGDFDDLADRRLRDEVKDRVRSVEHTMALEDQAPGEVEKLIEDEVRRRRRRP